MKLSPWEPDLRSLVDRIEAGDIDLQPDFQRQEVWATSKKKRLIDTVIREWSIPPIHMVVRADGLLEVLDGQQRLASIRDFFNNVFAISGDVTPLDARVRSLDGKFYKTLDISDRRRFDQYTLRCFRITDYQPEEPSELFYRLNQPTMLTAGEQRNALFGPAREQLKHLVALFISLGGEKETLGFSNARLAYDDILARLLFFVESGSIGEKSTETRISERFRSVSEFSTNVFMRCEASIEIFARHLREADRGRQNKASVLSWLIFYSRFVHQQVIGNPVQEFNDVQSGRAGTSWHLEPAVALFQDRASLRVTDVSSVIYRDFALCYLYKFYGADREIPLVPWEALHRIRRSVENGEPFDVAVRTLEFDRWSASL